MIKRTFDILVSFPLLIILSPLFLLCTIFVKLESKGPIFFRQSRVGRNNIDFRLYKFRTMYLDSDQLGSLTVGMKDKRITRTGFFLRKYKLDELPQLFNVLNGDMSLVGPRPEVRKYVSMYTQDQLRVLSVKPGITDYASILFHKENELLGQANDPEATYINEIMPVKLSMNLHYLKQKGIFTDLRILFKTIITILRH